MLRLIAITAILMLSTQILAAREVPAGMKINPRPKQPHTNFQTGGGYQPEHDIRTDAVIQYSCLPDRMQSWLNKGYVVQTMYGFRTGDDYIKDHRDEGQTAADGTLLTCGPGSYYMVPTQTRIDAALDYYHKAIANGTSMAVPEEPEFFTRAGYSESFKKEWQAYYNEPWQDPTSSIEARWKSERLKAHMEYRMVKTILEDAEKQDPKVVRAVAAHSPVTYYMWNIVYPHYEVMKLPALQEMIGQVWTGTARSSCRYEGDVAERTFETAYLEYSSLNNLMRGTGKRLWFLMDPLEDNLDRSMDDYQTNYVKTLVASLMFPEVDEFEVMPWPNRIFGRVPPEFATKIMSVVTMLGDIHNQKRFFLDAGTQGIATFTADSMGWQRGAPHPGNYDCFTGLTLPLIMKGIPVQVAQLERTPEPKYLDQYKVLLLSYDIMKPMSPEYNKAIAKWVENGGTLILFGGTDAYNELPEWWTKAGFRSPNEHLISELGGQVDSAEALPTDDDTFRTIAREEKPVRDGANKNRYTFDVSGYVLESDSLIVKIADALPDDGYGPRVTHVEVKVDGEVTTSFDSGAPEEIRYILYDEGSQLKDKARFADGSAYWVYILPAPAKKALFGSKIELTLDMANQFAVSAATVPPSFGYTFTKEKDTTISKKLPKFTIARANQVTAYNLEATRLYSVERMGPSPFFEAIIGQGRFIFCGITPSYFASSKEAADLFRAIVRYGCEKTLVPYNEQPYMKVRRGRYVAARSFDKPVTLQGSYVDVLDPGIRFVENPVVEAGDLGVYADCAEMLADKKPRMLLSSSRLEASDEQPTQTRLLLSGPLNTKSVVRLSTAGKQVKSITVHDPSGKPMPFDRKQEKNTLFLKHDGLPEGALVTVEWK